MSYFSELLNKPLPSKRKPETSYKTVYEEGLEGDDTITVKDIEDASDDDIDDDEGYIKKIDDEASQRIDDTIKNVATPLIVQDMLDEEEIAVLKESVDGDIAIDESYLTERSIVRLDKSAKRSQLIKVAVLAIAKEKNDPLYKKLVTLWKMERRIEKALYKKYESQAKSRAQKYINNAKKSKSSAIKKAVAKLTGK